MMTINKCPECGAKLVRDRKDFTYAYKGESVTLKKLRVYIVQVAMKLSMIWRLVD